MLPEAIDALSSDYRKKIAAFFQLIRPINALMFVLGVCLGAYLAGGSSIFDLFWQQVVYASLSALLIGCGANAINDYYDVEIDKINRPDRPIPAQLLTEQTVANIWGMLSILGIIFGFLCSWKHGLIAIFSVLLLFLYSARLKGMPFIGNLVVAFIVAIGIVFGALIEGLNAYVGFAFGFAFLTNLIREIVKDIQDVDGDLWGNAKTLAVVWGTQKTLGLVVFLTALLLLLGLFPYLVGYYSPLFIFLLLVPYFLLLIGLYYLWNAPVPQAGAKQASQSLKWVMLSGMLALLVR